MAAKRVGSIVSRKAPRVRDPLEPAPAGSLTFDDLLYAKADGVATVTLNRPDSYNAYTTRTLEELTRAVHDATLDDAVGVIVLTGAGSRAFCTGGDVKEYAERYTRRPRDYWKYMGTFQGAVEALLRCGKPTIARLNGVTVGGGNELHLACDLSVAGAHVYVGQVGVGVGSVACGGATQWLPLVVGDRRARAMLFLNERVSASRALEWGLVSAVAPTVVHGGAPVLNPEADEIARAQRREGGYEIDLTPLDEAVAGLATRLLAMFPECLRYTKQQVNFWKELSWNATIGHGREWLSLHFATPEPHEGMRAFVEKRPARVDRIRTALAEGRSTEYLHGPPTRACPACHATGLPEDFTHCGRCGASLPDLGRAP
jgi:enoyl-CoA hydratase/carnithine racemase